MSMEIHAILPTGVAAPTKDVWQAELVELKLQLVLHPGFVPGQARGFCPMMIGGREAGCEVDFNLETVESLSEGDPELESLPANGGVFSFRFGGAMLEGACAYAAAAGLIRGCGAVLYDTMDGTLSRDAVPVVATSHEFVRAADGGS